MKLLEFLFPFLFERDWHSGELELSRPRVVAFAGAVAFVALGVGVVAFLQMPVEYVSVTP